MELGRLQEKRVAAACADLRNRADGGPSQRSGEAVEGRRHSRRDGRGRAPTAAALRRSWRRASTRLRVATGVTSGALARERASERRTPWLGLLLWAIACAGLFMSLVAERLEPAGEPRLAASAAPEARPATVPMPFGWNSGVDLRGLPATR